MQFYNLKTKQKVEISDENIQSVEMPNGRMAATAENEGMKLFKFLGKDDTDRLLAAGKVPTKQEKSS
uniref:Uncharacterized protein n=1 Tax=candidate division WWE3 bacterium TaxID=2053526 RepID=A0A7C4XT46_UNCKA